MDKNFEIELQEETVEDKPSVQLPLNFLTFGEIESDDVKVYIKQDVYKALEKLASSDTTKELGSIILGDYCQELGKNNVIISNYVEAKYTDASASTLTFTHETWDYVHSEHERRYPDKKIIGWQHTHPNYGIFLSNYDIFIQENFFNLPFQIAYVIDPIQNIRGFFQWKNGKIEKLKGYYIYDDVGNPIKIEQTKRQDKTNKEKNPTNKLSIILSAFAFVFSIFIGMLCIDLIKSNKKLENIQAELSNKIVSQQECINEQEKQLSEIKESTDQECNNEDFNAKIEEITKELFLYSDRLNDIELSLSNNTSENDADESNAIIFKSYLIESGDDLISICEKFEIDYYSNKYIILSINGIKNENEIFVGQNILIPLIKE